VVIFRKEEGLTLLELLVSFSLLIAIVAVSVPSVARLSDRSRAVALANSFLADLQLARSESIRRGVPVVVCKRAGDNCAQIGGWHQGWFVFADVNNNASKDSDEETIRMGDVVPRGWKILGNSTVRSYVSYHPLGQTKLINGGFQAGTLLICNASDPGTAIRRIVINSRGRARVTDPGSEAQRC
jgi:type IV fimbrial biogenesis protein FimT